MKAMRPSPMASDTARPTRTSRPGGVAVMMLISGGSVLHRLA